MNKILVCILALSLICSPVFAFDAPEIWTEANRGFTTKLSPKPSIRAKSPSLKAAMKAGGKGLGWGDLGATTSPKIKPNLDPITLAAAALGSALFFYLAFQTGVNVATVHSNPKVFGKWEAGCLPSGCKSVTPRAFKHGLIHGVKLSENWSPTFGRLDIPRMDLSHVSLSQHLSTLNAQLQPNVDPGTIAFLASLVSVSVTAAVYATGTVIAWLKSMGSGVFTADQVARYAGQGAWATSADVPVFKQRILAARRASIGLKSAVSGKSLSGLKFTKPDIGKISFGSGLRVGRVL